MMKNILLGAFTALLFIQCNKKVDPFLIKDGAVGTLTKEMKLKQVDSLYKTDYSIVKVNSSPNALETHGEVEIYDKQGEKLMIISPEDESDPNSRISTIHIFDPRFKTEKGLTTASTFKDVKDNYTIENMVTTINSIVVFLNDSELYLTIDKSNLPEDIRYQMDLKVEADQIPDTAPIKYFMIGWDPSDK